MVKYRTIYYRNLKLTKASCNMFNSLKITKNILKIRILDDINPTSIINMNKFQTRLSSLKINLFKAFCLIYSHITIVA